MIDTSTATYFSCLSSEFDRSERCVRVFDVLHCIVKFICVLPVTRHQVLFLLLKIIKPWFNRSAAINQILGLVFSWNTHLLTLRPCTISLALKSKAFYRFPCGNAVSSIVHVVGNSQGCVSTKPLYLGKQPKLTHIAHCCRYENTVQDVQSDLHTNRINTIWNEGKIKLKLVTTLWRDKTVYRDRHVPLFWEKLLPPDSVPKVEQRGTFHHITISCRLTCYFEYPETPIFKENTGWA